MNAEYACRPVRYNDDMLGCTKNKRLNRQSWSELLSLSLRPAYFNLSDMLLGTAMLTISFTTFFLFHVVLSAIPPARLGPTYPYPRDLSSESSFVRQVWRDMESQLNGSAFNSLNLGALLTNLDSSTFSISAFSVIDATAVDSLQYHHTGSDVRNSVHSTKSVDDDSIYRLGSISKLFTVYTILLAIGPDYWHRPVANYVTIPGLSGSSECQVSSGLQPSWCQMGGILRDVASSENELLVALAAKGVNPSIFGFPSLTNSNNLDALACLGYQSKTGSASCPIELYLESVAPRPAVYPSWTNPSYSNSGFDLLALAVESITGRSFGDLMQQEIFTPLKMDLSSYRPPADLGKAVIPGNGSDSSVGFTSSFGDQNPSGGIFSSLADMSKFGVSILGSSLLRPGLTSEWLKPVTHMSSLRVSVGRPWEIYRLDLGDRTSDLYTTSGGIADYSTYFILSPDHNAGFTILGAANSDIGTTVALLTEYLVSNMVPALEQQAAQEAAAKFAGQHVARDATVNSSLTLSVDPTKGPGLHITSWVSNDTDFLNDVLPVITGGADSVALLPALLKTSSSEGGRETAFRASFASSRLNTSALGPLLQPINAAWSSLDRPLYGGSPIDLFLITVDSSGHAS